MSISLNIDPDGRRRLSRPRSYFVKRGILLATLLPAVFIPLCSCVGLGVSGEDGIIGLVVGVGLGLVIAAVAGIQGLYLIVQSSRLAERSVVLLSVQSFEFADGRVVPTQNLDGIRVRAKSSWNGWLGLYAFDNAGREVQLVKQVHPNAQRQLNDVAGQIADLYQVRKEIPPPRDLLGGKPTHSAALCYIPFQGLFLLFSALALAFSKEPTVRFAAKQSLVHFVFTFGLAAVAGGLLFGMAFISEELELVDPILVGVLGGIPLVLFMFTMNIVVRFFAAYRAWRGRVWVMPWLRPIVGRWAPDETSATAQVAEIFR